MENHLRFYLGFYFFSLWGTTFCQPILGSITEAGTGSEFLLGKRNVVRNEFNTGFGGAFGIGLTSKLDPAHTMRFEAFFLSQQYGSSIAYGSGRSYKESDLHYNSTSVWFSAGYLFNLFTCGRSKVDLVIGPAISYLTTLDGTGQRGEYRSVEVLDTAGVSHQRIAWSNEDTNAIHDAQRVAGAGNLMVLMNIPLTSRISFTGSIRGDVWFQRFDKDRRSMLYLVRAGVGIAYALGP